MKEIAGGILLLIGGFIALYGFVRYLVVVYRHGILWLMFCLVVLPVGHIAFLVLHFKDSLKPIGFLACGIGVQAIGCWLWPEAMVM